MSSPLLALFARSLREDSRLKSTYVTRVGLVLITVFFLLGVKSSMGWSNAPGLNFFNTIVVIDTIAILLAAVSYFASAITEEKEEMTLGLLRMTNLNPLSILFGKSTSRLCGALLLLSSQFPFTLLAIALGGVAMKQIVAAYCCLGAFLIFIANLALLASVICRRTGGAAILTGLALFLFFVFVPFANFLANLPVRFGLITSSSAWVAFLNSLAEFVSQASPFTRLGEVFRTGFQDNPGCFQVWTNLGMGVACFIAAWLVFEVFCGEQKESSPARGVLPRRKSLFRYLGAGRAWRLALAWKDFNFIAGGWLWVILKFIGYGALGVFFIFFTGLFSNSNRASAEDIGMFLFWTSAVILQIEIAFAAASFFRNERQWKTLSSLAMLPQGMRWVAYQKILGVIPTLIPIVSYMVLGLFLIIPSVTRSMNRAHPGGYDATGAFLLGLALTFSEIIFFHHLVANLSLRIKRGALPLGIGVQILLNMFGGLFFATLFRSEWSMLPLTLIILFGAVALHVDIISRLKTLAAEG